MKYNEYQISFESNFVFKTMKSKGTRRKNARETWAKWVVAIVTSPLLLAKDKII